MADKRRNRTSQALLQSRLHLKSHIHSLKAKCSKCHDRSPSLEDESNDDSDEESTRQVKRSQHCHCHLFNPNIELVRKVLTGEAYRSYKKEAAEKSLAAKVDAESRNVCRPEQVEKIRKWQKQEAQKFKRKYYEMGLLESSFDGEDSEEENMSIDENENELSNQLKVNFNGDDTNMKDSQGFTRSQPVPIECHRYEPRKVASQIIFGRKKSKYLARKRK